MVDLTLQGTRVTDTEFPTPPEKVGRDARFYVRLRPGDQLLSRMRGAEAGVRADIALVGA